MKNVVCLCESLSHSIEISNVSVSHRISFRSVLNKKTSLSPGNSNLHRTLQFHRNEAFSVEISGVKGVLPPGNGISFE